MPTRSKTLKIRVTPAEKEKIEEYMGESNEAASLSDFGRLALLKHITSSDEEQPSINTDEVMDAMENALTEVSGDVAEVSSRLSDIESSIRTDDETDKLAREIYHTLPEHESGDEFEYLESIHIADAEERLDRAQYASSPRAWAKWFGKDVSDIRAACGRMLEYYPDVDYVHETYENENGYEMTTPERRYYKTPQ